jgi:hypothetical protein
MIGWGSIRKILEDRRVLSLHMRRMMGQVVVFGDNCSAGGDEEGNTRVNTEQFWFNPAQSITALSSFFQSRDVCVCVRWWHMWMLCWKVITIAFKGVVRRSL